MVQILKVTVSFGKQLVEKKKSFFTTRMKKDFIDFSYQFFLEKTRTDELNYDFLLANIFSAPANQALGPPAT